MFSVATVFLLLASLVAAAGFAVVAQRRLRQLGMLAAVGATQKHLRLVLLANGALVGAIAALLGTIVGLALWLAVGADARVRGRPSHRPAQPSVGADRDDRRSLAVLGAIAAAWWPARTVARLPVVLALSGRPPKPRPARHAAIAAAVLIAAGIGGLALSDRDRPPLIVAGIVATILGCLLLGPPAIRIFSGVAGRLSIAPRLALRDLVRYQARSGAALAAVTLALRHRRDGRRRRVGGAREAGGRAAQPVRPAAPRLHWARRRLASSISPDALKQIDRLPGERRAARRAARRGGHRSRSRASSSRARPPSSSAAAACAAIRRSCPRRRIAGPNYRAEAQLYVATPAVLAYLGIDPATVDPGTDFLADRSVRTDRARHPELRGPAGDSAVTNVQRIDVGRHLFGSDGSARAKPPCSSRSTAFAASAGSRSRPAGSSSRAGR